MSGPGPIERGLRAMFEQDAPVSGPQEQTAAVTVPSIQWCGETHPHVAHTYARSAGLTGVYTQCPGAEQEITGDLAERIAKGVMDVVRAEVAAAEERGRVEGAAKERERIAKAIERAGFAYEDFKSSEHYRGGYLDGLGDAADLARGRS